MKKAKFAMAFHCHQPVFNLGGEIEKAYKNSYLPLLETIEKHPEIRVTFHYSGNLLEWFEDKHPEYIEKIKNLVDRGQIEIMGGGCFEPVMAMIPERDRKEQIELHKALIDRIFGIKPKGAWIAEKIWEPDLVDTLSSSDVDYTIIDDYHILRAGLGEEKTFAPCVTSGKGGSVVLFPSLTRLRYSMPFRSPDITLDYMKGATDRNGNDLTCFFFADDAEKFGAWPYTYKWVYEKGWLRHFFDLLQRNSSWLETTTYSDVMDSVPSEEVGEIPSSSYAEMMEWSGGDFKNFLKKYPEADRMYKRMISVSDMIGDIGSKERADRGYSRISEAKKELFKAQSNCAYWHGTFGGLYLPHLRSGVYEHLIKAQDIIEAGQEDNDGHVRAVERDYGSGKRETVISNRLMDVFLKSSGGAVSELDYRPLSLNLMNTMSRAKEGYHRKLSRNYSARVREARKAIMRGEFADVHDVLGVAERGLKKNLFYDDYERDSFLTHILGEKGEMKDLWKARKSNDSFLKGEYSSDTEYDGEFIAQRLSRRDKAFVDNGRPFDLEVIKEVAVGSGPAVKFSHRILKHSGGTGSFRYAIEFNFLVWDKAVIFRPKLMKTKMFFLKDQYSDVTLDFLLDRELTVFKYPVYTVNETEAGLKKTFQGVSVLIGDMYEPGKGDSAGDINVTVAIRG
ncbi:alpha-amylase/4-alpha-glucanotransferase domain-containing protein [Candidatus Omnitrophota bacterium]